MSLLPGLRTSASPPSLPFSLVRVLVLAVPRPHCISTTRSDLLASPTRLSLPPLTPAHDTSLLPPCAAARTHTTHARARARYAYDRTLFVFTPPALYYIYYTPRTPPSSSSSSSSCHLPHCTFHIHPHPPFHSPPHPLPPSYRHHSIINQCTTSFPPPFYVTYTLSQNIQHCSFIGITMHLCTGLFQRHAYAYVCILVARAPSPTRIPIARGGVRVIHFDSLSLPL